MYSGRTPSRTPGERIFKTTKSCSITSITHLRRELGFGARGEERDIAFKRAVRKQITTFVSSSDSIPAYKFTKWKNTVHQRGLLEVTKDFLDVQGKGSEFWPQSDLSDTTQPLQYWKDSAKIRSLMTKVFWRAAREYKRHKTAFSTPPLLSQSTDTSCQSKNNPADIKQPIPDSTARFGGNSAEDPIDLEIMPPATSTAGPSVDNDPFAGMFVPFASFPPDEDSHYEPTSSEPFSMSLFTPDVLDCQPTDPTHGRQGAPEARMQDSDLWEVPNSPPIVANAEQQTSKRPVEASSNDNNRQNKCPRNEATSSEQPTHPPNKSKKNRKATDVYITRRQSSRPKKQTFLPDAATSEEMMAIDRSSFLEASKCEKRQQNKDKANSQAPQASSFPLNNPAVPTGLMGEQSSAQAPREQAARLATEEAAAMATAIGAEGQPRVATGLSAKAQGKQPALPTRQAPASEAGPSREREVIEESAPRTETNISTAETSAPRTQTSAPRTQRNAPMTEMSAPQTIHPSTMNGSGGSDEQEQQQDFSVPISDQAQQALDSCELIYTTNMGDGVTWVTQRFPKSIFKMSLGDIFQEAGLDNSATLHLRFEGDWDDWQVSLKKTVTDEEKFSISKEQWLRHITKQHRRTASDSMAQRQRVRYFLSFSKNTFKR
ncbi:hypothetical protein ACHAO7_007222 [Fusarium culmorum]